MTGWPRPAFGAGAIWRLACLAIVASLALSIGSARAGLQVLGTPDPPTVVKAAEAYRDYLLEHAPGAITPLVDYAGADIPAAKCDGSVPSRVHAVLIGANESGYPFPKLVGPDNDVRLLYASLRARGVADDDIALMIGSHANRAELGAMFKEMLGRVNCGDRLLLHYGGNSARARDVIDVLIPAEVREPFKNLTLMDIWDEDMASLGRKDPASVAIGWVRDAGLFLGLNRQKDGLYEVISAQDLSDFISNLRNRQVGVTVTVDTSYASEADITGLQQRAGDTSVWSMETGGPADALTSENYMPMTPLQPNHGPLAVFYASIGDSQSVELTLGDEGAKTSYGVFTFRLANVIQNRDTVTIRAMAESLQKLPANESGWMQRYRVETGDPEFVLFSDATRTLPQTDPIVITKPTPKRGAAAIEKAEVEIEGTVNWFAPTKAVLVDGKVAELRGGETFRYTAALKSGVNEIEIVALTADGRTHEKTLEFVFEGDKKALEGEGKRYAVIIANETYDRKRTGFSELRTPFEDADAVAGILTGKYGFVTEATMPDGSKMPLFLKDATGRDIQTVLYKIGLVAGAKDTVLIYYAGHGIYEPKTTIAYWVPVDAEEGVPISYLSASSITEAIQRMEAGKVIMISDSCFSGALLRGGGEAGPKIDQAERDRALLSLSQRRSRVLISSGNNEPVEDTGGRGHSVFAQALITGLEDMRYDAFSARELFDGYLLPLVIANADQEPQYRPIDRAGHEGGDIVFVRRTQ